jgi:hypothetical protein
MTKKKQSTESAVREIRRVEIVGISRAPDGSWMNQIARNLIDIDSGFLLGSRYLIHDRDPLFTSAFGETLRSEGVDLVRQHEMIRITLRE